MDQLWCIIPGVIGVIVFLIIVIRAIPGKTQYPSHEEHFNGICYWPHEDKE